MSRRYYLAPIIGAGRMTDPRPWTDTTGAYRAKVANYQGNYVPIIPTFPEGDPRAGQPRFAWALCVVEAADHTAALADPDMDALPAGVLDTPLASFSQAVRTRVRQALTRRGIDTSALDGSNTVRDLIRAIGRQLQADFNEDDLDVSA